VPQAKPLVVQFILGFKMAINPYFNLRMKNLFAPDQMIGQQQQLPPVDFLNPNVQEGFGNLTPPDFNISPQIAEDPRGQASPQSVFDRIMAMYQPKNEYSQRLEEHLGQYPQREKPGFWRKLGASIVGLGYGPQGADAVLDARFNDQLGDWKEQLGPLQALARDENQDNSNQRMLATQLGSIGIRDERLEAQSEHWRNQDENAKARTKIYELKSMMPDYDIQSSADGYLWAIDTKDPNRRFNTGIKSIHLSDADLEALRATNRERLAGINNTAAYDRALVYGSGYYQPPDPNAPPVVGNPRDRKIPPPPAGSKEVGRDSGEAGMLPTQQRTDQYNKANEIWQRYPQIRKYFRRKPENGSFELKPPGPGASPESKQNWQNLQEAIYGKREPTIGAAPKSDNRPQPTRQGYIRIRNKQDGRTGQLPANQPIPEGWERIG
jgi:hypothetical protein